MIDCWFLLMIGQPDGMGKNSMIPSTSWLQMTSEGHDGTAFILDILA